MRSALLFIMAALLPILSSCSPLWNRANVGGLRSDVETLFTQKGIEVALQECSMVGSTRTGYCRFHDTAGAIDALIQDYNLDGLAMENATVAFIDAEFEAGCGAFSWILEGGSGRLFFISGRPQSLKLPSGSSFEYLLLTFDESSGEACLQVSYSYG